MLIEDKQFLAGMGFLLLAAVLAVALYRLIIAAGNARNDVEYCVITLMEVAVALSFAISGSVGLIMVIGPLGILA